MVPTRKTGWFTKYSIWLIGGLLGLIISGFTVGQQLATNFHNSLINEANGRYFYRADGEAIMTGMARLTEQGVLTREQLLDFCRRLQDITTVVHQIDKRLAIIEAELRKLNGKKVE